MTDDFLNEGQGDAREAQRAAALDFARLHTIFTLDERGKKLLEVWDQTFLRKRIPITASHAEYAAVEATRAFVQVIHDQIRLAKTEGRG